MRKILIALAVALVVALVLPASAVLAKSEDAHSFSATATLVQTSAGMFVPGPGDINLVGELFSGGIQDCVGSKCALLRGASVTVTQNATLFFTGFDPYTGTLTFAGAVSGTFTLEDETGDRTHTLTGSYDGLVSGTLTPVPSFPVFSLSGANASAWEVVDATGKFNAFKRASGSLNAVLGGFFPGGEFATVTFAGTTKAAD